MKINRIDAHDRLLSFQKQWETISQGVLDCIRNVPTSVTFPFYIFAHPRTIQHDEQISLIISGLVKPSKTPTTRMIYIPRITKPKAETNSYLFMSYGKHTDLIKTIWLLPPRETWDQYKKGNVTENQDVINSIENFKHARKKLEENEPDGPTLQNQEDFKRIIACEAHKRRCEKEQKKMLEKLYKSI